MKNELSQYQIDKLSQSPLTFSAVLYRPGFSTTYLNGEHKETYSPRKEFVFADHIQIFEMALEEAYRSFVEDIREFGEDGRVAMTALVVNGIDIEHLPGSAAHLYSAMAEAECSASEAADQYRLELDRAAAVKRNEERLAREAQQKDEDRWKKMQEYQRLGQELGMHPQTRGGR